MDEETWRKTLPKRPRWQLWERPETVTDLSVLVVKKYSFYFYFMDWSYHIWYAKIRCIMSSILAPIQLLRYARKFMSRLLMTMTSTTFS
jgi:hypothetical protein